MTRDDLHSHIRNPENYTAVQDRVSGRWLGTAYRAAAGHYRAIRFFGSGFCDGPYEAVEDAVEAIYLDYSRSTRSASPRVPFPKRTGGTGRPCFHTGVTRTPPHIKPPRRFLTRSPRL